MKHWGDAVHTNVVEVPHLSQVLIDPIACWWRTNSVDLSHAAWSFCPWRIVFSAMYQFQGSLFNARSLIWVMQWSIRRSHCSESAPGSLLMLMDWAISKMCSLTLLSFHYVVKLPISHWIRMVSNALWLAPSLEFSARLQTCWVGVWIVLASALTDFGNQKASHYTWGSQWWSMIEWLISNPLYCEQMSAVLNTSSRVTQCGSRGEEGVSKDLEISSKVGRWGEYRWGLGGVILIRRHHLGCYSARNQFA